MTKEFMLSDEESEFWRLYLLESKIIISEPKNITDMEKENGNHSTSNNQTT